ncbi:arginase family protein [Nonomuraea ceibae]|uniref:arginase family protein n=1 Tax=Nonomuraea ceibae TaxID=1935170 RepID=UPI001C5FB98D|nr:arginase family protein [Nonomuraea ceibae]
MGEVTVVEVPQWRGSGAPTAERLREGARLLAGMVPAGTRVRVDVVDDDLAVTAGRVRTALATAEGSGLVVVVGGDCGVELAPVEAALREYGERLVVVWFDAHGDLNTPDSSPSGAYHGMVLRALTGEGPVGLVAAPPLDPGRIVLAGVRDLDAGEAEFVRAAGVGHVRGADVGALLDAVEAAGRADGGQDGGEGVGAGSGGDGAAGKVVYVHVDLDVLEPGVFGSVGAPVPGGLLPEELLGMVRALAERHPVAGLGITEYEPAREEDRELLAPLVKALVETCAGRGAGQPGRTAPR